MSKVRRALGLHWLAKTMRFAKTIAASSDQRKHLPAWLRSLTPNYLLSAPSPWLTFDAIEFIGKHIPLPQRVFEYGSGGSTLFWLSLGATCVSIEHDPQWYDVVKQRCRSRSELTYKLVPPEPADSNADVADPAEYASADQRYREHSFYHYVSQIDHFPDGTFDVVLVDGRARPSCIAHSAAKVKSGGLLVLDNAERDYYLSRTRNYLEPFGEQGFWGVGPAGWNMWRTVVFVRR